MSTDRFPPLARLAGAIVAALAVVTAGHANVIVVDATCTLDKAIDSANFDSPVAGCAVAGSGRDTITISADNTQLTDELPWIVSDIDFVGSGTTRRAITGDGTHRLFFIGDEGRTPTVTFSNIAFNAGVAHGGNSVGSSEAGGGAGAGAGMGGALFITGGNVSVSACSFSSNSAVGGSSSGYVHFGVDNSGSGSGGGGGMFGAGGVGGDEFNTGLAGGSGGFGGGGGGGGDTYMTESGGGSGGAGGYGTFGGYGGTGGIAGSYNSGSGEFGGGGGGGAGSASGQTPGQFGAQGGFGGGGGGGGGAGGNVNSFVAGGGGAGGFGAGGGAGGTAGAYGNGGAGGNGGFGGGAGAGGLGYYSGAPGSAGFGGGEQFEGGGGGGAGFGGAIFIRTGALNLVGNQFSDNSSAISVTPGNPGTAKGGALFALHILHNSNGNDQGMPGTLPEVTGCGNGFDGNTAASAQSSDDDNASTFGASLALLVQTCDAIFGDGFDPP